MHQDKMDISVNKPNKFTNTENCNGPAINRVSLSSSRKFGNYSQSKIVRREVA